MDFLNHREVGMVFFHVSFFLFYSVQWLNCRNWKRFCEFEETEISRQSCREVTVTSMEENSKDCCLDFVKEFGLWFTVQANVK
jgi:hypothetical protein